MYELHIRQSVTHGQCEMKMLTTVLTFWVSGRDLT